MILTFQLFWVSTWGHVWPRWSHSLSIHIFSVCYSCIIDLFFSHPALPNSIKFNIGSLNQPSILLILAQNQLYQLVSFYSDYLFSQHFRIVMAINVWFLSFPLRLLSILLCLSREFSNFHSKKLFFFKKKKKEREGSITFSLCHRVFC